MERKLRILAVSALWQGANDYAFVRAFRRMGHSVRAINSREYLPSWQSNFLRFTSRILRAQMVDEYNRAILLEVRILRPHLFFVFKGPHVKAETLRAIRGLGAICIQFYPDTGFRSHSRELWDAIPEYDWFFSTKPAHIEELSASHDYDRVSFLPHTFDPETHKPIDLTHRDIKDYSCDVSFIGNISKKKRATLEFILNQNRSLDVAVWGASKWGKRRGKLAGVYRGVPVFGLEYAKAIQASRINLGLLFEGNSDGASPDVMTARTFEIPGAGGFMLHERTPEAEQFFKDGKECVFFDDLNDLSEKIQYYIAHDDERRNIALAGRQRCLNSGYSTDDRAQKVIDKYYKLRK